MKVKKNLNTIIYILFIILVCLSFLFTILALKNRNVDYSFVDDNFSTWNKYWEASIDGEYYGTVTLPVKLNCREGAVISLKKKLPYNGFSYNCLMLESKRQNVYVYVNNDLRTLYSDSDQKIGNSLPHAYVFVPLYTYDTNNMVQIDITTDTYYSGNISEIYIGDEMSILINLIKDNILWLGVISVIFVLSLICISIHVIFGRIYSYSKILMYQFWYAIFVAIWSFSQMKLRQVFVGDVPILESVGQCCFLLIPITIILVVDETFQSKYKRIYQPIILIAMINFLGQNICHTALHIDYFELQSITQVLSLGVLILSIGICKYDSKGKPTENLRYLFIGLLFPTIGIIAEAACMASNLNYVIGSFYTLGSLVFIVSNIFSALVKSRREQERKQYAESANLAKSRFLATMSHEIRTPINAVLGMNEMILRESSENVIRNYAQNIAEAGKSLLALVNDILDFSKIEAGKMDIVCTDYQMKSLLSDLIVMIKARMSNKELKLNLDIDEGIPSKYYGDEVRIKQVVTNLLTNAVKYTQEGEITFKVSKVAIENGEVLLRFSVKDTGMGIKEADLKKLAGDSSFTRVDEEKNRNIEGTGLGLAITKQLLKLMGSTLEITSEYGKGSEFFFIIRQRIVDEAPMGPVAQKKIEAKSRNMNTFTAEGAKILAVDDTRTNLIVIKGLLKPYKMDVKTCISGEECLLMCEKEKYDLIFMDHMMPVMDGIETFKQLQDKHLLKDETKVVVLTANAISGAEKEYKDNGFDAYISKPIDVLELDDCLRRLLPSEYVVEV